MNRHGPWMVTRSGLQYFFLCPDPSMITIGDIAHHLSRLNRFNGASERPYNVAQHSILVAQNVPPEYALCGLLHDAHEAYIGDLISPLSACPGVKEALAPLKSLADKAICQTFGIEIGLWNAAKLHVKTADRRILATEIRDLIHGKSWSDLINPYDRKVEPWGCDRAKREFLALFAELDARP